MRSRLIRITSSVIVSVVSIVGLAAPGLAGAASSNVYVSKKNCSDSGPGTQQTPYCTVQKGVDNVTPGGTVNIDRGTYSEQVNITGKDNVTLVGLSTGAIIKMPTTTTAGGAIVNITNAHGITLRNLTVQGPFNVNSCATSETGVQLGASASATLDNVQVLDIQPSSDNFFGCQQGVAVSAGAGDSLTVRASTVKNYAKDGIEVNGAGATATITQSSVIGRGPTNLTALNGIQISRGATATVTENTVRGNVYNQPNGTTASGILLYQSGPSTVSQNTLTGNDVAVDVDDGVHSSTVYQNNISNSTTNGIYVYTTATGNNLSQNSVSGTHGSVAYTPYDVEDDSTGTGTLGTANTWFQNACRTSSPANLCRQ